MLTIKINGGYEMTKIEKIREIFQKKECVDCCANDWCYVNGKIIEKRSGCEPYLDFLEKYFDYEKFGNI